MTAAAAKEWYDDPREVVAFYWWLVKGGYIEGVYDSGRYFEEPGAWPVWMRDRYEDRKLVA